MEPSEWRITKEALESEMLRLVSLLAPEPSQTLVGPPNLRTLEVRAANAALKNAFVSIKVVVGQAAAPPPSSPQST